MLLNRLSTRFLWLAAIVFLLLVTRVHAAPPACIWIEGESTAAISPADTKPEITSVGAPALLSGGNWLHITVDAGDVEKRVGDSGIVLTYKFTLASGGNEEIWERIGYENARSPFEWRVDGGGWDTVTPDMPTTDVLQLQTWNPVGWLRLTTENLAAGAHTIEIRLTRQMDSKGKFAAIQYASDCFCISAGPFHPNGPYRPDDFSWQTAADRAAATHVFTLSDSPGTAARTVTLLTGDWQIARWDEARVHDSSGPTPALPDDSTLFWRSIAIPGNRDTLRPEWQTAHRYLLRTQVNVPAALAGHALHLHFPATSLIATVYVNGVRCGWNATPFAAWDCDITGAVRPGMSNSVWVAIKDLFYALPDQGAREGDYLHYLPYDWVAKFGPTNFTFPVWNHADNGILRTPTLIATGGAYATDVFAKPSLKQHALGLEVTVHNSGTAATTLRVENSVEPLFSEKGVNAPPSAPVSTALTFAPQSVEVAAGADATVSLLQPWANPRLWWPDDPAQYVAVTRLMSADGRVLDEVRTKFGFREWAWDGPNFRLNGIPWHGRADTANLGPLGPGWLAKYRRHGQTMVRIWGEPATIDDDLDWYDSHGVCVRRTGIFDGEAARYELLNGDKINQVLFDNWRAQLLAWVRAQRNHPSIFIWSIENEIAFINAHVFGNDARVDPVETQIAAAVLALDPTRPAMTDGGNALLDQSLPIYGGHYMEPNFQSLPGGAYDVAAFAHREVWPVTQSKPILLGEAYYANGDDSADFATVGGESAFVGKAEAAPAVGLTARMLSEGYRWNDVNFHFWEGDISSAYYNSWQPVAVLCREWDTTFASGAKVTRHLKLFNDRHDALSLVLTSTVTVNGRTIARRSYPLTVAAGGSQTREITLPLPAVGSRAEGVWKLEIASNAPQAQSGILFTDSRPISILPPAKSTLAAGALPAAKLFVFDPSGTVQTALRAERRPFTALIDLTTLPANAKILVIGANAVTTAESASSRLAAYAAAGRTVIVLEQANPLHFQAVPAEMSTDKNAGQIAFAEDLDNPLLRGLRQSDFTGWGPDGNVYRDAYLKPASGARSIVQCDFRLQNSALVQAPVGKGMLLLSQLTVGEKLGSSPVARQLLSNLVDFGATYRLTHRPVSVAAAPSAPLHHALDTMGLQYSAADPLAALARRGAIVVVDATPETLHTLAAALPRVRAFTRAGGWLILNNVTPDGLADYNRLVGVEHLMRPFHLEKVTFPTAHNPLTASLAASSIVMGSGKRIFDYAAGEYPDPDAFSYVVDLDDIAPFARSTFFAYDKITNNYTMADGFWPLIINLPAWTDGKPVEVPITLPRPEKITQLTWVSDLNYEGTTKIGVDIDGKTTAFDTAPNGDPQTFTLPDAAPTDTLTLRVLDWQHDPAHRTGDGKELVGIDNIYLKAARSPEFYRRMKPLLNIGAMVAYPDGPGGIVLCNVKYRDTETNPENAAKKRTILATILHNLDAPFAGGKTIIAGAGNLIYAPIDLSHAANQYRNEQGWFGDRRFTFADLPTGRQTLAGVPYVIYNFTTSPVPTAVMLGGPNIPGNLPDRVTGILVGRRADALFFLQAARIDQRRSADDVKKDRRFEIAHYLVHYADGSTAAIPVYSEIGVDDYHQTAPARPIPGAQIAWTAPYVGTDQTAVAYSLQWTNPHPDTVIQSIDLIAGPDRRGLLALLAVSAAEEGK